MVWPILDSTATLTHNANTKTPVSAQRHLRSHTTKLVRPRHSRKPSDPAAPDSRGPARGMGCHVLVCFRSANVA